MTKRAVGAKKEKDGGTINQLIISQKRNLIAFFRGLSLKHELVCRRLCGYLEANNKHDGSGKTIVPWHHRPHGEIHYYGDLKGLR